MDQHFETVAKTRETADISSWFYWYSFNVMEEFTFTWPFDMLRDERWHLDIVMLRLAMSSASLVGHRLVSV